MPNEIDRDLVPEPPVISPASASPQPLAKTSDQPPAGSPQPSPELFGKILDLQGRELDIREKELAAEQVKQLNAHEFAKIAIEHQAAYLKHDGNLRHDRFKATAGLLGFGILVLAVLLVILPVTGHEQIALEILKDIVLVAGGGGGGYALAKRKSDQSQQPSSQPPEG